jgi:hypothetical protein
LNHMNDGPAFKATLVVKDGLLDREMGIRYLIQVDVKGERIFIDATCLVLRTHNGSLPFDGEYWLDGQLEDRPAGEAEPKR